jgi:methionyl-tRNA formyltransferase
MRIQFPLWTTFLGKRVQLLEVEVDLALDSSTYKPGKCVWDSLEGSVIVACGGATAIKVGAFKTEGRRVQRAHQWWQGASRHGTEVVLGT